MANTDPVTGKFVKGNTAAKGPKIKTALDLLPDEKDLEKADLLDLVESVSRIALNSKDTDTAIKGANLAAKISAMRKPKDDLKVSPFTRGILSLFNYLEDELGLPGDKLIDRMIQRRDKISGVLA